MQKEYFDIIVVGAGHAGCEAALAAARIAGADRIFKLGGAQAVAALAYGTESVPRGDKTAGTAGARAD